LLYADDLGFAAKMNQEVTEERIATLFAKTEE